MAKYIIKYNFPYCTQHTLKDKNGKPFELTYAQAKECCKKLETQKGVYTKMEEVK